MQITTDASKRTRSHENRPWMPWQNERKGWKTSTVEEFVDFLHSTPRHQHITPNSHITTVLLQQPAWENGQTDSETLVYGCRPQTGRLIQLTARFVHTFKCFFPGLSRTCKDQIPGFSRTQKSFFQDFPGNVPFKTLVARGQKMHIQNRLSGYLH